MRKIPDEKPPKNKDIRLFLTTYQGSGTYQIMPALDALRNVVDKSYNSMVNMPWNIPVLEHKIYSEGKQETTKELMNFRGSVFGHISYLAEYEVALRSFPTKALFNIRDPRDVIVSEYHKMLKMKDMENIFWLDFKNDNGEFVHDKSKEDAINEFIIYAAARWPRWLGWLDCDFVLPVRYEDLRKHDTWTLGRIEAWVDPFELPPMAEMLEKLEPRQTNPTFRKGAIGDWKVEFTDKNKLLADRLLGDIVERLGYGW